ncbi:DUF4190 domain-containing protein [Demequina lutea]|uniref:DUF4190 domain-containing protein n=1 Tax=Demequina lutea TaxID=431489 RepID=A0A7Z0CLB2_9MICO|nr:DUF4190 domain-containing protein [Demequina lutea]NYI42585.1 hypothetical protein [Demequina lutea]
MRQVVWGRVLMWLATPLTITLAALALFGAVPWTATNAGLLLFGAGFLIVRTGVAPETIKAKRIAASMGWASRPAAEAVETIPGTQYPFRLTLKPQALSVGRWRDHEARRWLLGSQFAVEAVALRGNMPALHVIPNTKAFAKAMGGGSDFLTGDAAFDAAWRVWCRYPEYARAMLSDAVRALFASERLRGVPVLFEGGFVCTWTPLSAQSIKEIDGRFESLAALRGAISNQVLSHYSMAGSATVLRDPTGTPVTMPGEHLPGPGLTASVVRTGEIAQRDKNLFGRLSVLLPFTFFFAPVGLVLGILGARAAHRGEASNGGLAKLGIGLSIGMLALLAVMMWAAITVGK